MKYNIIRNSYSKLTFFLAVGLSLGSFNHSQAKSNIEIYSYSAPLDSVRTVIDNGFRFVIHQVQAKETYYSLSRKYGVPVQELTNANANKNLRIGDTIKIPRGKVKEVAVVQKVTKELSRNDNATASQNDFTEYIVGKSETLYAISRRFRISVEDIKKYNGLNTNSIKEGQILKIPKTSLPQEPENIVVPEVIAEAETLPEIITENQPIDDSTFRPNKYGIREKKERGIGLWQENLSSDGQVSLALHKTAPIGTILKITNPMNQSVTFAKVVGKFGDNQDTQGVIVVLSKSVASSIGLLDKKFQVEITYGVPLD